MSAGRSHRRVSTAAVVAAICVAGVHAEGQARNAPETPGHFLTRPAVPIGSARQQCLELGDDTYTADVRQADACAKLGFTSLGLVAGVHWYSALVSRRWLLTEPGKSLADTAAESELVLFTADTKRTAAHDTLVTPVWHYRFEPEMLASVTPEIVAADGGTLVAIMECVNGTGGCAQSFFMRRGARWQVVRLSFLDSLNHRFPGAINHGFHVDPWTLRASAAVYSPNDANCCPSRTAEMRLRLRGDALELIELRVRPAN